jgi:thioesterase domain-containing protein/acyl carrier protein
LVHIWEEILNVKPISVNDNFFELGGHSLLAVRLMAKINQQLGRKLPLAALFQGSTIENLARLLRQTELDSWSPLVSLQPLGDKSPFFCVHPVGGNVLAYASLARLLGTERPVYGLQSLGLEEGQEPYSSVEEMAAYYLKSVRLVQPVGPYLLGGWSMGGVIAFEMARQLHASGQTVATLILIDSIIPHRSELIEKDDFSLLTHFALDNGIPLDRFETEPNRWTKLAPNEQLNYVFNKARELGLLPAEMSIREVERLFALFKSNRRALRRYMPQQYLGRITLFSASEQLDGPASLETEAMNWAKWAVEGVDQHRIEGNHYTIIQEPQINVIAAMLRKQFEDIDAEIALTCYQKLEKEQTVYESHS